MNFFDNYSDYYKSNERTLPEPLNVRYRALIENNNQIISGKRILFIGSENVRRSFEDKK